MLTVIEKVLFLQDVENFEFASTEDLARIAAITEEVTCPADETIYREGEYPDAMYMVVEGRVRLHRNGREVMLATAKDVFGSWALFDDTPRVVTATSLEMTRLLRIRRDDFYDLLADHVKITESIFKSVVKRMRRLLSSIGADAHGE